jgi:hypothetical protein
MIYNFGILILGVGIGAIGGIYIGYVWAQYDSGIAS